MFLTVILEWACIFAAMVAVLTSQSGLLGANTTLHAEPSLREFSVASESGGTLCITRCSTNFFFWNGRTLFFRKTSELGHDWDGGAQEGDDKQVGQPAPDSFPVTLAPLVG